MLLFSTSPTISIPECRLCPLVSSYMFNVQDFWLKNVQSNMIFIINMIDIKI